MDKLVYDFLSIYDMLILVTSSLNSMLKQLYLVIHVVSNNIQTTWGFVSLVTIRRGFLCIIY